MKNFFSPSPFQILCVLLACEAGVIISAIYIPEEPFKTNAHYLFSEAFRWIARAYAATLAAQVTARFLSLRKDARRRK